jgi:hypothetical protein
VLEVHVLSRDTVRVAFDVSCSATGALIAVTTTGLDIDPNGYRVLVDGAERAHIQPIDTVLTRLEPGSRTIALTDLSPNCTTAGPASRIVTVVDREVVSIEFAVACTVTSGVVGILVEASGPLVHEGFELLLDGVSFTFMPGLRQYLTDVPAGDHVISLLDTPHCKVETGTQPASVTAGDTVQVDFSARCSLPQDSSGTVRVSTPTTGRTPPSTRYTLRYAVAGYWDYGFGALTFLGTVDPNGTLVSKVAASGAAGWWYEFALGGVPTNCSVRRSSPTPSHPMGYTITAGDTLSLVFAVTCPS